MLAHRENSRLVVHRVDTTCLSLKERERERDRERERERDRERERGHNFHCILCCVALKSSAKKVCSLQQVGVWFPVPREHHWMHKKHLQETPTRQFHPIYTCSAIVTLVPFFVTCCPVISCHQSDFLETDAREAVSPVLVQSVGRKNNTRGGWKQGTGQKSWWQPVALSPFF